MKRISLLSILFLSLLIFLTSCGRKWIIEVDGYILHKTDGKYYIAQIPDSARNESIYEIPTHVGQYEIYGFGSDRSLGIWAGKEEIKFGHIRKLVVKNHIKSIYFNHYQFLLIETEQPLSKIDWEGRGASHYVRCYFLSPKEDLNVKYVDRSDCYDGIVYEIKNDGFSKVLFNYSSEFTIHNEHKNTIVNEIGEFSFSESNISEIFIPNNITIIGDYAFQYSSLKNISLNNVVNIGEYAFENSQIEKLDLPNTTLKIEDYAFSYNKIKNIIIPQNLSHLGIGVFKNNEIESFKFESVHIRSIPEMLFYGCPLTGELNYGEYINSIRSGALSANDREELVIPSTITSFGDLSYCDNLKKIYLPNTPIIIYSFSHLDNLEELHLGGTSSTKGFEDMYSVSNLRLITVSDDNEKLYVNNGILYNKNTNAIVKCPPKLEIEKIQIDIKPYRYAFSDNFYIKEAIINCELSEGLFSYCKNLEKVKLADSVKIVPRVTFFTCSNLKEINLNNIVRIEDQAFFQCESLNKVDLSNCEVVKHRAFKQCNLYEVIFTSKIREIEDSAFANNKKLRKCNYYNANLGEHAFYDTPLYKKTKK